MSRRIARLVLGLSLAAAPLAFAPPAMSQAVATAPSAAAEDARLQTFLDAEFQRELDFAPQTATIIGRKDHADKWDDQSEAGLLAYLEWRRGSVARLKAGFDRARLGPEGRMNYDMWAGELDRAELRYKHRRQSPPLYSYLYSPHQSLPNFLINTVVVDSAADMRGYNARLRALGAAMDEAVARSRASAADGVRAPRFQYERVIAGGRGIIAGQPFAARGPTRPCGSTPRPRSASCRRPARSLRPRARPCSRRRARRCWRACGPATSGCWPGPRATSARRRPAASDR